MMCETLIDFEIKHRNLSKLQIKYLRIKPENFGLHSFILDRCKGCNKILTEEDKHMKEVH